MINPLVELKEYEDLTEALKKKQRTGSCNRVHGLSKGSVNA